LVDLPPTTHLFFFQPTTHLPTPVGGLGLVLRGQPPQQTPHLFFFFPHPPTPFWGRDVFRAFLFFFFRVYQKFCCGVAMLWLVFHKPGLFLGGFLTPFHFPFFFIMVFGSCGPVPLVLAFWTPPNNMAKLFPQPPPPPLFFFYPPPPPTPPPRGVFAQPFDPHPCPSPVVVAF